MNARTEPQAPPLPSFPDGSELSCEHDPKPLPLPSPVAIDDAAGLFRALGDPARLRLVCRLAQAEACVSELAAELDEGLSTVSQRLRLLRAERVVTRRREGKHVFYALADHHVLTVIRDALDHVGEDDPLPR